jgi:hypothetical protein
MNDEDAAAVVAHAARTYLEVGAGVGVEVGAGVGVEVGAGVGELVGLHTRSVACWLPERGMARSPCPTSLGSARWKGWPEATHLGVVGQHSQYLYVASPATL